MVNAPCMIKEGKDWEQGVVMGFVQGELSTLDHHYNKVTWPVTFAIVCIQDKLIEVTLDRIKML